MSRDVDIPAFPRQEVLDYLTEYEKQGHGPFSWPDDGLSNKDWAYDFHVWWVSKWNKSEREKPAIEFIRELLREEVPR